jgi:hypothetical protein
MDCSTGHEVEIRGRITADVSCSPLRVIASGTPVDVFFVSRP